jgi:PAS domain S-box-containing protein
MRGFLNARPQHLARLAIATGGASLLALAFVLAALFGAPASEAVIFASLLAATAAGLCALVLGALAMRVAWHADRDSERNGALLEDSPDAAIVVREADDDYICEQINAAGTMLFAPDSAAPALSSLPAGKTLCDVVSRAARAGVRTQEVVLPRAGKDDVMLRVHVVPLPAEPRKSRAFAILCRDMTALRQAERDLRERSLQLEAIIDSAMDAILITDAGRGIILFNPAAERMFGYAESEMLGRDAVMLAPESMRDDLDALFHERAPELDGWRLPSRHQHAVGLRRDGAEFPIEIAGSRVDLEDHRLFAMVLRDMSERDSAESEIRALNEKLEQRVAQRTEELQRAYREMESFSYSVSHDLRAPLRAIHGYTYLLIDGEGEAISTDGRTLLEKVMRASVHMGDLIDDFLDFSRVGRIEFVRQQVDMNRMVSEVLADLRAEYPDTACSVGVLASASGDPRLLRQVWQNLISNALKFSARQASPRIEIGMLRHEGRQWYSVSDNGIGFDMDYADKLFGVFQRIHTSHEIEGTGIGLAIVKRVIERHQGGVRAEGVTGQGARFSFWIPG